jgi:hypothetical protein
MTWYLTKTWTDPDGEVDAVQIHYMWTPVGDGPFFDGTHQTRWLADWGGLPRRRGKVLSLPRSIWTGGRWSDDGFALHHYFEVHGRHGRWTTDTVTEEIVTRDLEFVDHQGAITNICIHWAVDNWMAPTYSPMEDDRFPADGEFASVHYYGYEDKPRFHRTKAEMLYQIPLPHRWRARMWGPRGSTLVQQYHVGHLYPEHERGEAYVGPDGMTMPCGSHWVHQL